MALRTLPGIGMKVFWDLGTAYKDDMDSNLRLLSALTQAVAVSRNTPLPSPGSSGDIFVVPPGAISNANEIAIWDGEPGSEGWVYLAPLEGWTIYIADESRTVEFDGTSWGPYSAPLLSSHTDVPGAGHVVADADLAGNRILKMSAAGANSVTVNAGLTGTEPLTIIQTGVGPTSVVAGAGVSIQSLDGNLTLAGQYASATLIPDGLDSYILVGALVV